MPNEESREEVYLSLLREGAATIDSLRAQLAQRNAAIAIVGMACRFPGSRGSVAGFRALLHEGRDAVDEIPAERWDVDAFYDPDREAAPRGKMYTRQLAALADVDRFDAEFFGISPREAQGLDPQHRFLLELTWEALEDAACAPSTLNGREVGVFVGIMNADYKRLADDPGDVYAGLGNVPSTAAGRISYLLGFTGPSMPIDTACSSSLVAVHLACQSLRQGECELAVAGGVNLVLAPDSMIGNCVLGTLAADGRCKTFAAEADGIGRGEGCAIIVLQREKDARRAGARIHALIRGSAVNQDGRSNGMTAPNGPAQERVLRAALSQAGVAASDVGYVEAHGTGTPLGDPIELHALDAVYGERRDHEQPLLVGSVKTNLGHLESAAGIAGLIKAVIALQDGVIPRHLHFTRGNERVGWDALRLRVAAERCAWPARYPRRLAGVSAFGLSGTNAHLILEAERAPEREPEPERDRVLVVSAQSEAALTRGAAQLARWLRDHPEQRLLDVCYTASHGRDRLTHRLAVLGRTHEELAHALESEPGMRSDDADERVVFAFGGHGAQWLGMGRALSEHEPAFAQALTACSDVFEPLTGWSLCDELARDDGRLARNDSEAVQVAVFALSVAQSALWKSWGVLPAAVVGHSLGEVAAAHVAGILSLADAARVVATRARLLRPWIDRGAMALVPLSLEQAEALVADVPDRLAVGVHNGPNSCAISGDRALLEAKLAAHGIEPRWVDIRYASHSPHMDVPARELAEALVDLRPQPAAIAFYSTVTGMRHSVCDGAYWARNLRAPVTFAQTVAQLSADGYRMFADQSPHPILSAPIAALASNALVVGGMRRGKPELHTMRAALARLWRHGVQVDWAAHHAGGRAVSLPSYAWDHKRHWCAQRSAMARTGAAESDALYRVSWQPSALSEEGLPPGRWLVVADRGEFAQSLAVALQADGAECTTAAIDDELAAVVHAWRVRGGGLPHGVVFLGTLHAADVEDPAAAPWYDRALELAQALDGAGETRLFLVTRGALESEGGRTAIWQAPLVGLARVLRNELPELGCVHVDLDPQEDSQVAARTLARELRASSAEPCIRWRAAQRSVARLARHEPPTRLSATAREYRPRQDGSYVITGGLGGLGLAAAAWLAERGAGELVLIARRPPDDAQQQALARLRERTKVTVCSVDVADRAQLSALLRERELPVRGVIHTAAAFDTALVRNETGARYRALAAAKVRGAHHLHELTADLPLDFFVLYSSAAATFGWAGQSSYVASNAFVDALASLRRSLGLPALSIAWGKWAEVGAGTRLEAAHVRRIAAQGFGDVTPAQAERTFMQLLVDPPACVTMVPIDWARVAQHYAGGDLPPLLSSFVALEEPPRAVREDDLPRRCQLAVEAQARRVLGLGPQDALARTRPLVECGLDSLMAVELRNGLARELGLKLPATVVFDHPTLDALTAFMTASLVGGAPRPAALASTPHERAPIAIVGIGCRLPSAAGGPEAYWSALRDGRDAVRAVPERWRGADRRRANLGWEIGALDEVDQFDAAFFGISPREAETLDPQHRALLEVSWEALEDAGIDPTTLSETRTGVYVGILSHDYTAFVDESREAYAGLGNMRSTAGGRIAYSLGLIGPSMAIDTACSSSLVAVHLACQGLVAGDADLALAAGVNMILAANSMQVIAAVGALAPDGRCKTFDASADGMGRGEGCAVVVLKRSDDAARAGDRVYATILGSAINQDGRSNGMTAPNGRAQERVIRDALARAGVVPQEVGYVEAHGTGTRLGDPIELAALENVFAPQRTRKLLVGSAKTNFGHLEAAAGITGLVKTALAIHHGQIPRHLHFSVPNPALAWDELQLEVPLATRDWPEGYARRVAGVSAFGISGTNAHVVLGQADAAVPPAQRQEPSSYWLPLSAKSDRSLRALAREHHARLCARPECSPRDVAYSVATRRSQFDARVSLHGETREQLLEELAQFASADPSGPGIARADLDGKLAFVFPGHGSQRLGMARELLACEPVFAKSMADCERALREFNDWSLLAELRDDVGRLARGENEVVQPSLFAISISLAALWRSWGVQASAVVGHSMGEIAAAHVAGILSLRDAAAVVSLRAQLLRPLVGQGAMALVGLDLASAERAVADVAEFVSVAVNNAPHSTVLSGELEALKRKVEELRAQGVACRWVDVSYGSHSPAMESLRAPLLEALADIRPRRAALPMYSTLLGRVLEGPECGATYWMDNLRQPVLFATAVEQLIADGYQYTVELSPHPILLSPVQESFEAKQARGVAIGSLRRNTPERSALLHGLGELWQRGYAPNFEVVYAGGARAELPTYAWDHRRHWAPPRVTTVAREQLVHPLLGYRLPLANGQCVFESQLAQDSLQALALEHFGGAALLELCFAAGEQVFGQGASRVDGFALRAPLQWGDDACLHLQTTVQRQDGCATLSVSSRSDEGWRVHCEARLVASAACPTEGLTRADSLTACELADEAWPRISSLRCDDRQLLAELQEGDAIGDLRDSFAVHPAWLDACVRALARAFPAHASHLELASVGSMVVHTRAQGSCTLQARLTQSTPRRARIELALFDDAGAPLLSLRDVELEAREQASAPPIDWLHTLRWEPSTEPSETRAVSSKPWLLIGEGAGLGDALATALCARGATVVRVPQLGHALPPCEHGEFGGVVQLSALDARPTLGWIAAQERIYGDALSLMQTLAGAPARTPARVWFLTRGAYAVASEPVSADQAALAGFVRGLAAELPEHRAVHVDLPAAPSDELADEAELIVRELERDDAESQVALRAARQVARLVRVPPSGQAELRLRADASYLISGGLTGLGLQVARLLAERGAGELVLLGRRGATADSEPVLEELRARGVSVRVEQVDVRDRAALAGVFAALRSPLRGIVHAAGSLDDASLDDQSFARFLNVARAKAEGALHLHALSSDRPLDFFVLFSSAAAQLGTAGQLNYAAANALLDALARARRAQGLPAQSIAWGTWSEVGLAARMSARARAQQRASGMLSIPTVEGLKAFEQVVSDGAAYVMAAPVAWSDFLAAQPGKQPLFAALVDPHKSGEGGLLRMLRTLSGKAREKRCTRFVSEQVRRVLKLRESELDVRRPLKEYGMDSLMALELRSRLARGLDLPLSATLAYNHPTVSALVEHVLERVQGEHEEPSPTPPVKGAPVSRGDEAVAAMDHARLLRYSEDLLDSLGLSAD